MSTDTPRTDAVQDSLGGDCCAEAYKVVQHARTLERELSAKTAECEKLAGLLAEAHGLRPALLKLYGAAPECVLDFCNKARAALEKP